MKCKIPAITLLLLSGIASTSANAGFAAPLMFDKPQYLPNETVTLAVKGVGQCKNIEINWGDGQKELLPIHDFGAIAGANNLIATHKYSDAKTYFPTIKTVMGPTLAEQCGSHSGSVTVVLPGKLLKISSSPAPATVNVPVEIIVDGVGVCPAAAVIRATPPSGGAGQSIGGPFTGSASWPRKVSFTPNATGIWIVGHAVAPGQDAGASPGCFSLPAGSDGKLVVTAAASDQQSDQSGSRPPAPVIPGRATSPASAQPGNVSGHAVNTNQVPVKPTGDIVLPCSTPTINAIGGNLTVGPSILLNGCGYESSVGEVVVQGTFNNQTDQSVKMLIDSWNDSSISIRMPAGTTGAPDQVATLRVITHGGKKSADKAVNFVAKRQKRVLTHKELGIKEASNPGVYDWHLASYSEPYAGGMCMETVCIDRKLMPVPPFSNSDSDNFGLHLKNGWAASDVKLVLAESGADFNMLGTTTGPVPALANTSGPNFVGAKVKWAVLGPYGWIRYKLRLEIEGPHGVPFK